jgi:hypothetical protein
MVLTDDWHMCANSGPVVNDNDLVDHIVIGQEHRLMAMAERKLRLGVWDCVWIFPPGSNSDPGAAHPGNTYWVGELAMEPGYISWINLDE